MIMRKQTQAGLTLIELLVVVLILGILSSLAFPAYSGLVRRARYAEAKQQMGVVAKEVKLYHMETGSYPPDVGRDVKPSGILNWPQEVPFNSHYDYDHWSVGGNQCYVQIGFGGESGVRAYPTHTLNKVPPGFGEFEDNLVLGVDLYTCAIASRGPIK